MSDVEGFVIRNTMTEADIDIMVECLADQSYWAPHIPRETVAKSVENCLPFVIYEEATGILAGFARVITDKATFAYLGDVFVRDEFRGRGLSKFLMATIIAHPDLQGLRRFLLFTRDAHTLYQQFGFDAVPNPEAIMQRVNPAPYPPRTKE